jgi:UDP-N-acetylglucosamine 4,6-dehydratase (inverting)
MKNLLITGGTGSFGKHLLHTLIHSETELERIVIYSRDELKQWEIQCMYPSDKYPQIRFFLGDVRDRERLRQALSGVDTVVHAAALKQVPAAEYNPMEFVKTNVLGAENLIHACLQQQVKNVVALSTDKAASPVNLYGATKLCSDKLFVAANNIRGSNPIRFSVVRYGNVMGSRGSVIPYFIEQSKKRELLITHPAMTRFNISLTQGIEMVLWALKNQCGSEIFVPKIPSYRITDLAQAIGPNCKHTIIGVRPGEKIHEEMITTSDSPYTLDLGLYYAIYPDFVDSFHFCYPNTDPLAVPDNFSYSSGLNPDILTVSEIRQLIKCNVSSDFVPV